MSYILFNMRAKITNRLQLFCYNASFPGFQ